MQNEPIEVTLLVTSVLENMDIPYLIGGSLERVMNFGLGMINSGDGKAKISK